MQDIEHLPPELTCQPLPLIALTGLDTENNSVHRSIWRAFTTSRGRDSNSFNFISVPIDHQYPVPKFKPPGSYDWSLPKGILKNDWMQKHLEQIPSVVAVFFDLDWGDRLWEEKTAQCATCVETVRSKLSGRETKLVVILIQKRAPLPLGDDPTAMERAQSLCTKCELPVKNLFVLSPSNHLLGCITRLENEFSNIATTYYHEQTKKVKAHKDYLNRAIHQLLFVRHEFKIGFFAELKQDPSLALKHYNQAYNHLLELRMTDIHLMEIKTVSGFINYKICRLSFQTNASDAIAQFRRHIDFFSNLVGVPFLAFEHEAWMSKQFEILGDLFQSAIRSSLTALITQHPGLYYQEAARHSIARRQLCKKLCAHLSSSSVALPENGHTDADILSQSCPLTKEDEFSSHMPGVVVTQTRDHGITFPVGVSTEPMNSLKFYGQRPWRPGSQSMSPPNQAKEIEGIRELQLAESRVDHSEVIIPLLEQTHYHYQRYKADRMKLYPLVLMSHEYYMKTDFDKALSCYSTALSDYRREKWWPLYTHVLRNTFKCAYLAGQLETFVSTALELIGPCSLLNLTEKTNVQHALLQLLQRQPPDMAFLLSDLEPNVIERVRHRWIEIISHDIWAPVPEDQSADNVSGTSSIRDILFDVSRLPLCIECRVAFTQYQNTIDRPVQLAVFLRLHAPLPLLVRHLTVDFVHKTKLVVGPERAADPKSVYQTSQTWSHPFILDPSQEAKVVLLCVDPHVLNDRIRVDAVQLEVASPNDDLTEKRSFRVLLSWHPASMDMFKPSLADLRPSNPNTSNISTLWSSCKLLTAPDRLKLSTLLTCPHPNQPDCLLHFPSFPHIWDLVGFQSEALINERNSELEVKLIHSPPALSQDVYTLHCRVSNKESIEISNVNLSVQLAEQPSSQPNDAAKSGDSSAIKNHPAITTEPDVISIGDKSKLYTSQTPSTPSTPLKSSPANRINVVADSSSISSLNHGQDHNWPVYLLCSRPGKRSLRVQCSYDISLPSPVTPNYLLACTADPLNSSKGHWLVETIDYSSIESMGESTKYIKWRSTRVTVVELDVLTPFTMSWHLLTTQQAPISDLIVDEHFLLLLTLANNTPFDLQVLNSSWTLSPMVTFVEGEPNVQVNNLHLHSANRFNECQLLVVQRISQDNELIELGHYSVRWRRSTGDDAAVVTTVYKLLSCTVLQLPLQVHGELPAIGVVYSPMPVSYVLENRTIYPQEVCVQLESSAAFMFSGQNKVRLRVLPGSPQTVNYMLLPLQPGYVALPRLRLSLTKVNYFSPEDQQTLKLLVGEKILRDVPTHIFVIPQAKSNSSSEITT